MPKLLGEDYKVTVVDNLMFDQTSLNHVCHDRNFDFVKADVRLKDEMEPLFAKADIIYRLQRMLVRHFVIKIQLELIQLTMKPSK